MNFQELGLALQRERETRGLTIKEVMESTKISRINLLALESGDSSSLPHPVYTKGFVRSYARLLGLDADELSMVVDREYQMEEQNAGGLSYDVSPNAEKAFHEADAPAVRKRSVWPSILIVIVLCCAVLILVLNLNKGGMEQTAPPATSMDSTTEPVRPAELAEPEGVQPEDEGGEDSAVPADSDVQSEAVGQAVPSEQAMPTVPSEKATPAVKPVPAPTMSEMVDDEATDNQEASAEAAKYAHVVIIRATTNKGCWIGVWRGDELDMARDFVLTKGEPLRLMFNSPRRIRIGNAAGVSVTYNGAPYPLDQAKGNIQTILFGM